MLTRFEVTNFKNFNETLVFDLSAVKNYEFNPECVKNGVVQKAMIYGENGCGKSNLGLAMFDLISHLTDKNKVFSFYNNYLNVETDSSFAEFYFSFKFNEIMLEYRYKKKAMYILLEEKLTIDGTNAVSYVFGKPVEINLKGAETLNKDLGGSKISALKYIKSNAVLENNKINNTLKAFFNFVDRMLFFRSLDSNTYIGYTTGNSTVTQDILNKGLLQDFESFLNNAGVKCKLKEIVLNGEKDIAFVFNNKKIIFWNAASTGTQSLALFYYWLQSLKEKNEVSLVFIDEFDAFYHHKLSKLVVNELKKSDAQVILTTHNTSIMTNDLLRPDCYFIMQDNKIEPEYKLTDAELRFAHNLEKMYRAGTFNG